MSSKDFEIPDGLSKQGQAAAKALIAIAEKLAENVGPDREASGGGCRAFYTPEEWADKGNEYGLQSELIICHDGGDLAPLLNMDYECYSLYEKQVRELQKVGVYAEGCTCWYSAIYPI